MFGICQMMGFIQFKLDNLVFYPYVSVLLLIFTSLPDYLRSCNIFGLETLYFPFLSPLSSLYLYICNLFFAKIKAKNTTILPIFHSIHVYLLDCTRVQTHLYAFTVSYFCHYMTWRSGYSEGTGCMEYWSKMPQIRQSLVYYISQVLYYLILHFTRKSLSF